MTKLRVLAILKGYPTLSETYKESELRYLQADYEVQIASFNPSQAPYQQHYPYTAVTQNSELARLIKAFRPDVIHGHYLTTVELLHNAARAAGVRYTVRTHSFDVIGRDDDFIRRHVPHMNSEVCAGVLAFPFLRETLVRCGLDPAKLVDAWPVVDFDRFYDRSPNGDDVMNTGACIPKKNMESFVDLARMTPEMKFSLYPIGYAKPKLMAYNEEAGSPVAMRDQVEPFDMPRVYKTHRWLVYTGNPAIPTLGWPLAVAEAQASGVGVLVQRVRDDMKIYVGPGGYVFDSLEEARDIIRGPFPEAAREASFEHARRSDIRAAIHDLAALWRGAPAAKISVQG